ncbi:hypothetical protein Tco_0467846 [Tanacetum coccineum]
MENFSRLLTGTICTVLVLLCGLLASYQWMSRMLFAWISTRDCLHDQLLVFEYAALAMVAFIAITLWAKRPLGLLLLLTGFSLLAGDLDSDPTTIR